MRITEEAFVGEVVRLCEEKPDFVYMKSGGMCFYTRGSNCDGCLFGQALMNLGIPKTELEKYDGSANTPIITILLTKLELNFSSACYGWAQHIQSNQDTGKTWGECLKRANSIHPEVFAKR